MTDALAFAGIAGCLSWIAARDARRFRIDPLAVSLLAAIGAIWRLAAPGPLAASLVDAGLGAALGLAFAALPIAAAQALGRRWPVMPGDGLLLGAAGIPLGPLGVAWATAAGCLCAVVHRVCVQRRRRRPVASGYAPLAPGLAVGAMIALSGGPLAQGIAATEIRTPPPALPAEFARREASLAVLEPVSFPELARRISGAAGVPVEIEERPSRIAGGAADLPDPPPIALSFEGALPGLLRLAARRSGYDWTWRGGAVVFYRHRDAAQRAPEKSPDAAPAWLVDSSRHGTLRAVLEAWAERAGWRIVWRAAGRYAIDADAAFDRPDFLAAVDALLADAPRGLTATAWRGNRHLVIDDR